MDNRSALMEIFENITKGRKYGRTQAGPRWAYFDTVLYLVDNFSGVFIGWNHYGSSANACTINDLEWIITTIFETTPAEFIKTYEWR